MQRVFACRLLAAAMLAGCLGVTGTSGAQDYGQSAAFSPPLLGSEQNPVRVPGGIMAGQILHRVTPLIPPAARNAHINGAVVIAILIDPTGCVARATVISGPEALREPYLAAVRQWTYKPFLVRDDQSAYVQTTVTINVD